MDNSAPCYVMENEIYFIDGIMSFLKATRARVFFAFFLYMLVMVFECVIRRKPIEFTTNHDDLVKQRDEMQKIHNKFIQLLQVMEYSKHPFFPDRLKKRFHHYDEFLENIADGLAISADREATESIEKLPGILTHASGKLPTAEEFFKTL